MPYKRLRAADVERTAERLHRRIEARFPGRHLADVAARLTTVVGQVEADAGINRWMRRLRLACIALICFLVAITVVSIVAVAAG